MLRVLFVGKLRDEQKFADVDALKRQIAHDAAQARQILSTVAEENHKDTK